MKNQNFNDKKKVLRQTDRLTVAPRQEGKAKNAGMNPVRKPKQNRAAGGKE